MRHQKTQDELTVLNSGVFKHWLGEETNIMESVE